MNSATGPYMHDLGPERGVVLIGQVFYDATSEQALAAEFCPLENKHLSSFFEADVVRAAIGGGWHAGADFVGIFSWRFRRKIPLSGSDVIARLTTAPTHDVYSFFGALDPGPVWRLAERKHPGILAAAELLFERLGLGAETAAVETAPIYQNHFIARADLYERFVAEWLGPALDTMADPDDDEMQAALLVDSGYRDARHEPGELERLYGVRYLPLHPFIAERLFSTWLATGTRASVHALWSGRFVEPDDVAHEPELTGW